MTQEKTTSGGAVDNAPPRGLKGAKHEGRGLRWLVLALTIVGLSFSGLMYYRYRSSESHILERLTAFKKRGAKRTVEQCVDDLVEWARTCRALESMCLQSAPRLMRACLAGQDRLGYCRTLKVSTADTRFGFKECKKRKADKKRLTKKVCAVAYRQVDAHCRRALSRYVPAEHGKK